MGKQVFSRNSRRQGLPHLKAYKHKTYYNFHRYWNIRLTNGPVRMVSAEGKSPEYEIKFCQSF